MMRVIDHPSMLKDGSGYGAMAGTSALAWLDPARVPVIHPGAATFFHDKAGGRLPLALHILPRLRLLACHHILREGGGAIA